MLPALRSPAWLVVSRGATRGKVFDLKMARSILGRDSATCEIVLVDESVARMHARIRNENGSFVIYDFDTANGTFVNGEKIQRQALLDEDEIRVGNTTLVFKQAQAPRDAAVMAGRPTGVTILAVLDFIGAGFCALALAVLAADPYLSGQYGGISFIYLPVAIGYAVLGWGMWTLRGWARILQIAVSAIGLLGFPVGTIIYGYIIYWLTRPHVVSAFSSKR